MQIHGNKKLGIPCKKELFVVGSGTIYQLKCEAIQQQRLHCWCTNALMHSLDYLSKHKESFINYTDIHIKLAATKRTLDLVFTFIFIPFILLSIVPSIQPTNQPHLSTHVNPRLY